VKADLVLIVEGDGQGTLPSTHRGEGKIWGKQSLLLQLPSRSQRRERSS
jgi:hypothetical protein